MLLFSTRQIVVLYHLLICFVRCNARILGWLRNLRNTGVAWQLDDGHADSDSYAGPNTNTHSDSDPDSYANTYSNTNADTYSNTDANANTNSDPNPHASTAWSGGSGVRGESWLFERNRELGDAVSEWIGAAIWIGDAVLREHSSFDRQLFHVYDWADHHQR